MGRGVGSGCLVPEAGWVSSKAREGLKVMVCPKGSLTRELVSHMPVRRRYRCGTREQAVRRGEAFNCGKVLVTMPQVTVKEQVGRKVEKASRQKTPEPKTQILALFRNSVPQFPHSLPRFLG